MFPVLSRNSAEKILVLNTKNMQRIDKYTLRWEGAPLWNSPDSSFTETVRWIWNWRIIRNKPNGLIILSSKPFKDRSFGYKTFISASWLRLKVTNHWHLIIFFILVYWRLLQFNQRFIRPCVFSFIRFKKLSKHARLSLKRRIIKLTLFIWTKGYLAYYT